MDVKWINNARHGGGVQRAHSVPMTIQRHYSVAEHTFNAIIIARAICESLDYKVFMKASSKYLDISETNITTYLLQHDIPECFTGDMPANIKRQKSLKEYMDFLEDLWVEENIPDSYNVNLNDIEKLIVKLADRIELVMFCHDEYTLGNRHSQLMLMYERGSMYAAELYRNYAEFECQLVDDLLKEFNYKGVLQK